MEIQFCKLGLISPEGSMPDSIKNTFQLLWANNGDIISKQYAGTNALKVIARTYHGYFILIIIMMIAGRLYQNWGKKVFGDYERWNEFCKQVTVYMYAGKV